MSRIAYYPGCSNKGSSIEYEISTQAVCERLGVGLEEIPNWSCCGSTPAHAVDPALSAALTGRNIMLAGQMGHKKIATPCPSCLKNLRSTQHKLQNDEFRARVEKLVDGSIPTDIDSRSVLQIIFEEIGPEELKSRTVKPLKGLKVAPYYGCMLNRPEELMDFGDSENPMALDLLMEALGAEVVQFPLKTECCGASVAMTRKKVVTTLSGRILDTAAAFGADAVVTACPLCQMNLDMRQGQINRANKSHHRMPVFYYTQLIGLALGLDEKLLALDKLYVSPDRVLKNMGKQTAEAAAAR
ncbi:CoB--CoM heterodisulfide reductase iron-sulfur subunit B family protein [Desulfobaculum bizertense]|uniref:Heterodisulfide reductase subunit B n=1 Tax=Desulfobaculum bizertense DSM 18034 TaxID=1121442 RepID=A0A1T4W8Z4_9BACT|nr:CoB--CoM heterodisulfide reductase iron-sulfur subunit B family protein [Desulfobaculum bizertense]UIJ39179.1 CoB--CoM heterodisulfide reductase iron-sulfur subunit B family protein [Desulfobaculum bizertense]SKA73465.1 heterodisulfide reductase subunit B [Desulfobaculum bizertense DSM 18034]